MKDIELQADVQALVDSHDAYWQTQMSTLTAYRDAYMSHFWGSNQLFKDGGAGIETAAAYNFIEMYVNGMSQKQQSVFVIADATSTNEHKPVEVIINRWLSGKQNPFEDATRKALLYPAAFVKLCMGSFDSKNPVSILNAPYLEVIDPWDVITDWDAPSWDRQRFVAHRYWLPLSEAKNRFERNENGRKVRSIDWKPTCKNPFFTDKKNKLQKQGISDHYKYICCVEYYDLLEDRVVIFTNDTDNGFEVLLDEQIPLRDTDDKPLLQIVPLYFAWNPDVPLLGMSTLARVYDQIYENNLARTWFANAVKTTARKNFVRKTEEEDAVVYALQSNLDNEFIPVESTGPLADIVYPVPQAPIPDFIYKYLADVDKGIAEATILAPTAKGQPIDPTKSATEINYMMSATGSELNKMSRQKDAAIEAIAKIYTRLIYTYLDDDAEFVIDADGATPIKKEHLSSNFIYSAVDQGASPIAIIQKRQALVGMTKLILELQAAAQQSKEARTLLQTIVSEYGFDQGLVPAEPQEIIPQPQQPTQQPNAGEQPIDTTASSQPMQASSMESY